MAQLAAIFSVTIAANCFVTGFRPIRDVLWLIDRLDRILNRRTRRRIKRHNQALAEVVREKARHFEGK